MFNRQQLCQQFKLQRQSLSYETQQVAAEQLTQPLIANHIFQSAKHIAAYMAFNGEISPALIIEIALQQNKTIYLPALADNDQLIFVRYHPDELLALNRYQIIEPIARADNIISAEKLDLVLMPLVAVDNSGNRLGMGKGYYDRTFAFLQHQQRPTKPCLVGLAYEWQIVSDLSAENWDIKLDLIATNEGISTCITGS